MLSAERRGILESVSGFSVSVMGLYTVLMLATIPVLLRRQHMQPLKFRDTYLLIATIMTTYLATISIVLMIYVPYPYCILEVLAQVPGAFMMSLVMTRFWKLFLASRLTCARLCSKGNAWILRHPWMASTRNIWRGALTLGAVLVLIQHTVALTAKNCLLSYGYWMLSSVLLMAYWVSIAFMTWMLRNVQDGFFVVKELRMLGPLILITNIFIIAMFNGSLGDGVSPGFIAVSSILQMAIQAWYPIWKSYAMAQHDQKLLRSSTLQTPDTMTSTNPTRLNVAPLTASSSFLSVLRHPDGFEAMKEFLKLEFSVENILCWEQLHGQKYEFRPEQVQTHFASIYEKYVRVDSPNEVNISSNLKVAH